jgi:hypothetical protein
MQIMIKSNDCNADGKDSNIVLDLRNKLLFTPNQNK